MKKLRFVFLLSLGMLGGCEEAIKTQPYTVISDDIVILTATDAEQALLGVYSALQSSNTYGNLSVAVPGVLSDELFHSGSFPTIKELDVNQVLPANVTLQGLWTQYYHGIYLSNVVLERIEKIKIDAALKSVIIGQAKYLRALMHFDLAKLYGPIPLATVTDLKTLSTLKRTSQADVYTFVISELTSSATLLQGVDYGAAGRDSEDRVKAGEWAAKALLARVQLYAGNKAAAGALANDVIVNGGYTLPAAYSATFNGNSSETIFEVFQSSNDQSVLAFQFRAAGRYEYAPTPQLVAAFEAGDARAAMVINPATRPEATKYKDTTTGTDRAIISRLAEMYLIRAEAALPSAAADADVNKVRTRAGLANKIGVTLDDILKEKFVELCFEGHRWNDLVRTGKADVVMPIINPSTWAPTDKLLPIPQFDINQNPNILPQNDGY